MKPISSPQNHKVKEARKLLQKKFRWEQGRLLVEGLRWVQEAVRSQAGIEMVFFTPGFAESGQGREVLAAVSGQAELLPVTEAVFAQLAATESPQGVAAVVSQPRWQLAEVLSSPGYFVFMEGVQDPGNVGSVIRAADAFGAAGVILVASADPFAPKALRSSMGSVLHLPVVTAEPAAVWAECRRWGLKVAAADPHGGIPPWEFDWTGALAVNVGSEARGLSAGALDQAAARIRIPTPGRAESLNVALAAGIMLYEASRRWRPAGDAAP